MADLEVTPSSVISPPFPQVPEKRVMLCAHCDLLRLISGDHCPDCGDELEAVSCDRCDAPAIRMEEFVAPGPSPFIPTETVCEVRCARH